MSKYSLAIENSWRDLKNSDGRISFATQAALLFFLITLSLSSHSIQEYLKTNLDQMLGSDMVLENHGTLAHYHETALGNIADVVSKTALSDVTLTHENNWARVQLKQVDDFYPVQGSLQIATAPTALAQSVTQGPKADEIWLGPRLAAKLSAQVGDTLILGGTDLTISAILLHEPDRLMEGHSVAMRAMIHSNSGHELDTSNLRLRYLISADASEQEYIETWVSDNIAGAKLIKKYGGVHPLAGFWKRTENFLGLASVILFFMGAVALDMTNRRWLAKMRYRLALYNSFGTHLHTGISIILSSWFFNFLLASIAGTVFAWLAHLMIIAELQAYFPNITAVWSNRGVTQTIALVFLLLLALKTPSFIQLRHTSLLSLIRNSAENSFVWQRLLWGLISVTTLAAAYSDNWLLTAMTLIAIFAALVLMTMLTWCIIRLGDKFGQSRSGLLPFVFFIMRRRLFAKSSQIMGLGLCGLLVLFTLMLMRDLGGMLENYSRTHDGNLIISEAQENQLPAIKNWAKNTDSQIRALRPFVSAQLIEVNGSALNDYMQKPSDTLAVLQDPIRLSWTDETPRNNQLMGGTWWEQDTPRWQQISTEPEVMTDMGFNYGDELTYMINGRRYTFTLVASHAYKSGGGSITFWFQVPFAAITHIDAPTRYMGSMELPDDAWGSLSALWQRFPTLSLVPLKELTDRFDDTLGIVSKVTNGYAVMILLLALFVLAASVSGYRADDALKNGLLLSMGLKKKDCLKLNFYDWAITAIIAAVGAISGTWIAGILIYEEQFSLPYNPDILWVLGTVIAMVSIVCLVGYMACRQSLQISVRDLLQS
ncbi:ABC transporter permease [Kordiimonas sp. SCSIO 12610]|uniref:ABC transporter permease n=1 Tax=Kordiimonas sp. SCSIO 12610 TaxID=2829597 RepID=UPI00210CF555|nr:FtsX-like permease family protein [Kordiimonas sp. SCSIO 12610]UTW55709.1 FtsX-like permease family protein [Kordiimonas sp. SCSIO 12610]